MSFELQPSCVLLRLRTLKNRALLPACSSAYRGSRLVWAWAEGAREPGLRWPRGRARIRGIIHHNNKSMGCRDSLKKEKKTPDIGISLIRVIKLRSCFLFGKVSYKFHTIRECVNELYYVMQLESRLFTPLAFHGRLSYVASQKANFPRR